MGIVTHFPPDTSPDIKDGEPLLFLAGPIQGAPDWQAEAITTIAASRVGVDSTAKLHIANPRRQYIDGTFNYNAQVAWEKYHLKRAANCGAILVWFAARDHALPYEEDREYAKTTKDELIRAIGWKDFNPNLNLIVGIDPEFESLNRYKMSCLDEYDLGKYTTLDDTVSAALKTIYER